MVKIWVQIVDREDGQLIAAFTMDIPRTYQSVQVVRMLPTSANAAMTKEYDIIVQLMEEK